MEPKMAPPMKPPVKPPKIAPRMNTGAMVVEAALAPVNPSDGSLVDLPDSFNLSKADLVIKQK